MYKEEYYDYSGKKGKRIKDELKKRGFHHVTISNFSADFFRMSKSQLEKNCLRKLLMHLFPECMMFQYSKFKIGEVTLISNN